MKNQNKNAYKWSFCSIGGIQRVQISKGADIAHLDELDQKLWTVLSCPVKGLEFDQTTLDMLDSDKDEKIRVPEIIAAAKWLTSLIKDNDLILKGDSELPLDQINTSSEEGQNLYAAAKRVLVCLGKGDNTSISVQDAVDGCRAFLSDISNGDGVITPKAAGDDAGVKSAIESCIATMGAVKDLSGEDGVNAASVENFYKALQEFSDWYVLPESKPEILPYGENTAAAYAAFNALKDKVSDYFVRCRLVAYDGNSLAALGVSADKYASVSNKVLSSGTEEIAAYPLAIPSKDALLSFDAVNPAWKSTFDILRKLVFEVDFNGKDVISEQDWNLVAAKFEAYSAWIGGKQGAAVESLGIENVKALLEAGNKAAVLALIDADSSVAKEVGVIREVNKLLHYYRDFYKLLKNYVVFSDFYTSDPDEKAIFECGELYIDQRCCKLCIKVSDMGKQADMAGLSGMYLIYCHCTSKTKSESMDIVAVMTDGSVQNLRPGKNAIFYDREGLDWDAVVTKIVDNPISIKQAFWSPYRKFTNFIAEKIEKSAKDKDSAALEALKAKSDAIPADMNAKGAAGKPAAPSFDIAKFAGIFAAIGMALGYIGAFFTSIFEGAVAHPLGVPITIAIVMLCISGPSCFLAGIKLHRRNLGPVLNANGWAINSVVLVNIMFGATLTVVAKYPKIKLVDPYKKKGLPTWLKWLITAVVVLVVLFVILFFTNSLSGIGLPFGEQAAEAVEAAADTATVAVDTVQ